MEGLRKRALILGGALAAIGAVGLASPRQTEAKSEQFLEERAPQKVPGFSIVPNAQGGTNYTYKMDETTYEVLDAYGIVARKYAGGSEMYDVVVIASDTQESFHDPQVCFRAQGWTFLDTRVEKLDVPGRGTIPLTVARMSHPRHGEATAVYFYRGPGGFTDSPRALQWKIFAEQLLGQKAVDCAFYRFMPDHPGATLDQLKAFIKTYMVSANESSKGYF